MSVSIEKINKIKVKKIPACEKKGLKPCALFDNAEPKIYLLGKSGQGKTTIIYNILKYMLDPELGGDPNHIVIFFAGQLYNDDSYIKIVKWLKAHKISYIPEISFYDKEGNNQLEKLRKYLKRVTNSIWEDLDPFYGMDESPESDSEGDDSEGEDEGSEADYPEEEDIHLNVKSDTEMIYEMEFKAQKVQYEEEPHFVPPRLLIVIDDLSSEMRHNTALTTLLKECRHTSTSVIVSTQSKIDLPPSAINQMNYVLAFAKIPSAGKDSKLEHLYNDLGLSIPYELFRAIYLNATAPNKKGEKSRNFLYIDAINSDFRKNFDVKYTIKNDNRETEESSAT